MHALRFSLRSFSRTNQSETDKINKHLARIYNVGDIVISKGYGVWVEDVEGNKFIDFHTGSSSVSQGHSHPRILQTLYDHLRNL